MTPVQDGGSAFPLTFPLVDPKGETDINIGLSKRELVAALILGACIMRVDDPAEAMARADVYAKTYVEFYDKLYGRQAKEGT
jgi:hypothetical protein